MRQLLRVGVTLLASSAMVALVGAGSASASTPPPASPPASPVSLADVGHGLMLAQASESAEEEQEQKAIKEIERGIREEKAGIQEEEKGVKELERFYENEKTAPAHGG